METGSVVPKERILSMLLSGEDEMRGLGIDIMDKIYSTDDAIEILKEAIKRNREQTQAIINAQFPRQGNEKPWETNSRSGSSKDLDGNG